MIPIYEADRLEDLPLFDRAPQAEEDVGAAVDAILADVRARGDTALREYTRRFNGADLTCFEVTEGEMEAAWDRVDEDFRETLRRSADNIRRIVRVTRSTICTSDLHIRSGAVPRARPGVVLGQRYTPIEKVGVCVPGSPVAFPSTILMNVIPAKIAGVREIVVVTPPDESGAISPEALAAAKIAGADRVFKLGGAQAVAALAYGTETVPRVDKIVGPGNQFVAEAKKQVFGQVGIDMVAGPSEVLVIADESADPAYAAAHPEIQYDVIAPDGTYQRHTYEVMAAFYSRVYRTDETGVFRFYYYGDLSEPEVFDSYITQAEEAALYDTGVRAEYGDRLLTLITCDYYANNGRFVLVAREAL